MTARPSPHMAALLARRPDLRGLPCLGYVVYVAITSNA